MAETRKPILRSLPALLGVALAALIAIAPAARADEPIAESATTLENGRQVIADEVLVKFRGEPRERVVGLEPGRGVTGTLRELRRDPDVRWAAPNAIAHASVIPRDPGRSGERGGWQQDQWNFLAPPPVGAPCSVSEPCGVDAPRAWSLLRKAGHSEGRRRNGKRGPIVAIVDTGVAYRDYRRRFRRSPDLARGAFTKGRDVIGKDRLPLDENGHGTHVASTIIERTGNRRAVTGLADGLRIMPVRVLDGDGSGSAREVAKGIRFATRNGAKVINLSLEFGPGFSGCGGLRGVCRAVRAAHKAGIVVVGAAGNAGSGMAQMPAKLALGVASTTIRGCLSDFSSRGPGVDISAPGGGFDSEPAEAGAHCRPVAAGPSISQLTLKPGAAFRGNFRRFGYPTYEGTSMAAPHVSAAAALVLSSRVLARKLDHRPSPAEVEDWLQCTARPVGDPDFASLYGAGMLDLAAALDPKSDCAPSAG